MGKVLEGKRAIVTGAGQGLGIAISKALATDGAQVLLTSRSAAKAEAAAKLIRDGGGAAERIEVDLARSITGSVIDVFGGTQVEIKA